MVSFPLCCDPRSNIEFRFQSGICCSRDPRQKNSGMTNTEFQISLFIVNKDKTDKTHEKNHFIIEYNINFPLVRRG